MCAPDSNSHSDAQGFNPKSKKAKAQNRGKSHLKPQRQFDRQWDCENQEQTEHA